MPDDELGGTLAQAIQEKEGAREWLTEQSYVPDTSDQPLGHLEEAFRLSRESYRIRGTIKDAIRDGQLPKRSPRRLLDQAQEDGVITAEEAETVREADRVREEYIQVDEFDLEEYRQNSLLPGGPTDRGALDSQIVDALDRDPTQVESSPRQRRDGAPPRGDGAPQSEDAPRDDRSPETA